MTVCCLLLLLNTYKSRHFSIFTSLLVELPHECNFILFRSESVVCRSHAGRRWQGLYLLVEFNVVSSDYSQQYVHKER